MQFADNDTWVEDSIYSKVTLWRAALSSTFIAPPSHRTLSSGSLTHSCNNLANNRFSSLMDRTIKKVILLQHTKRDTFSFYSQGLEMQDSLAVRLVCKAKLAISRLLPEILQTGQWHQSCGLKDTVAHLRDGRLE